MKKTRTILITLMVLATVTMFAQVEREMVVVEIGTGTWCQYCPGSAMGADDLIANGHDVAIIEYHSGDAYQNAASTSRISYYNITGFPTAVFDGTLKVVGGSATQSMYSQYLPRYNQRKAINSSFTVDVEGELYSVTDYAATITVEKVAAYSGSNLKLQFAVTESHIEESWQGMDELNFVERLMVPSHNGTTLDFSGGDVQIVELEFSLEDDWNFEEMEIVAFVQDNSTKECLQATKLALTEFPPAFNYNASVDAIRNVPVENCSETVSPIAKIRNNGEETLTSLALEYNVNGGEVFTYNWTGSLEFTETADVELPEIAFVLEDENIVVVTSLDPNGEQDEYPDNDTKDSEPFTGAFPTPLEVKLMLKLDGNPEETSWDVLDSDGQIVFSGGNYTDPGQMIMETFEFALQDCYTFNIYDSGEDGLSTPGFYMLYYGSNTVIIQGTSFGAEESIQFGAGGFVGIPELAFDYEMSVYPNPARGVTNLGFTITELADVSVEIFNMVGELVYTIPVKQFDAGLQNIEINTHDLKNGVYFISLSVNGYAQTEKISILN